MSRGRVLGEENDTHERARYNC